MPNGDPKTYPVFVRTFLPEFPEDPAASAAPDAHTSARLRHVEGDVTCTALGAGGLYAGTAQSGLWHMFGKRAVWHTISKSTSPLPGDSIHALQYDSCGMLWIAGDAGVCIYDGTDFWRTPADMDTLPQSPVYSLCIAENGWRCFGGQDALLLLMDGQLHYLGAERWLPGGKVLQIAVRGNAIYAKCEAGSAKIEVQRMTLEEKAQIYQANTELYHLREGFVAPRRLAQTGDLASGHVGHTDNDGLWTGVYVAAQALRYAVTQGEAARACAANSLRAMLKLTAVTGIPGFTARAIRRPGARGYGDGNAEWIPFADETGAGEWKCETSSDEMVGQFFGQSYYFDLCADAAEKAQIRDTLCAIVDHMLQNDYRLCDADGLPTTWGNWNPSDLNHDSKWFWERGVNAAEMLMFLRTAHHVSGDEKYLAVYDMLAQRHHYLLNAVRHKIDDGHDCHIDDKLAMFTFDTLLRYETRPSVRAYLLDGLCHHWRYERVEQTPLWNFIASAHLGRSCDVDLACAGLAQFPLDLITYPVHNSHRPDVAYDAQRRQLTVPLPYTEAPIDRFGHERFAADGGDGCTAIYGTIFLLPYWYGRYHGLIEA
ncbi:MAG: hypothetical protein LBS96_05690 [Oscillospiraceae bacterium]|jgi:hypothetical protein|nr:hypothetical protein [Oscillospiraceae bacterium]